LATSLAVLPDCVAVRIAARSRSSAVWQVAWLMASATEGFAPICRRAASSS